MATKKGRRWSAFKGKLPTWQGDDPSYLDKVSKKKEELASKPNPELAQEMRDFKYKKEELKEQLEIINLELEARQSLLAERFDADGTQAIKINTGENFFLSEEPYAKVVDKHALNQWFKENDMEDILSPVWTSLNALVKERLEAGQNLPPGVDVFMKTTVVMRRS